MTDISEPLSTAWLTGEECALTADKAGMEAEEKVDRWYRKIDTTIVVLLSLASLLAAWSGYQAGLWSGEKSSAITQAEALQIDATRATTTGNQDLQIDVALFLGWLNAYKVGNEELAAFYVERFTPTLEPAFAAWQATDPLNDSDAPLYPFSMDAYQNPQLAAAARYDELARQAFAVAERYGAIGDAYVLATLLLAVVLFFGGVCTKIGWRPAQLALLGLAVLLLLYSTAQLARLPDGSAWGLTPIVGAAEDLPPLELPATPVAP